MKVLAMYDTYIVFQILMSYNEINLRIDVITQYKKGEIHEKTVKAYMEI